MNKCVLYFICIYYVCHLFLLKVRYRQRRTVMRSYTPGTVSMVTVQQDQNQTFYSVSFHCVREMNHLEHSELGHSVEWSDALMMGLFNASWPAVTSASILRVINTSTNHSKPPPPRREDGLHKTPPWLQCVYKHFLLCIYKLQWRYFTRDTCTLRS